MSMSIIITLHVLLLLRDFLNQMLHSAIILMSMFVVCLFKHVFLIHLCFEDHVTLCG